MDIRKIVLLYQRAIMPLNYKEEFKMKSKRLLAFLLTICMIGGLIPTVFAAEGEPVTLVYDFACTVLDGYNSTTTLASDNIGNLVPNSAKSSYWKFESKINVKLANFQSNGFVFTTSDRTDASEDHAVVFTINVPTSGTYSASVKDHLINYQGEWIDIYLVSKAVVAEEGWDVTTIQGVKAAIAERSMTDSTAAVKHIASYDTCYNATGENDKLAENVYLLGGDYYMFLVASDSATDPTPGAENAGFYAVLSKLTLTSEDASAVSADVKYTFTAEAQNGWTGGNSGDISQMLNYTDLNSEISTGKWKYCGYRNLGTVVLYSDAYDGFAVRVDSEDYYGNNAVIFKVDIEKSGMYKPSMVYRKYVQDGRLNVYFVPVSYADSKWDMKSSSLNLAEIFGDLGVKRIASQNGWLGGVNGNYPKEQNVYSEYDNVYLNSEEYYVLMSLVRGDGEPYLKPKMFFYTKGLTLTRQPEVSLSAPEGAVKIGKTATLSTVLTNEAGTPITVGSFAYKSSNPSVAEVSNNGVVTGVAEGTATIQVTATVCGVEFTDSVDITIEPELEYVALATANNVEENSFEIIGDKYTRGKDVTASAEPEITVGEKTYVFRH